MTVKPMHVGVVGSGIISRIYLENMTKRFDILQVDGICSAHMENAKRRGDEFGIPARPYEEMLADENIELIVNLTPTPAHEEIIRKALEAGKHVYTEKTMTASHETAQALKALAAEKGLLLGSAPDTFLGSALQTARDALDRGEIGEVTSFAFAANRCNDFLTSFFTFLNLPAGGVGYDYAVYYLTALVALLGPVAKVGAVVRAPYLTHEDVNPKSRTFGQQISTPNESEISAVIQLKSGVSGTAMFNCDSVLEDQSFFAIYGTRGILYLCDPNSFGGEVQLLRNHPFTEPSKGIEVLENRYAFPDNSRGVGPAELAYSVRAGRPCRASADMACHVLEVIDGIIQSGRDSAFVTIHSICERPEPLKPLSNKEEESIM